MSMLALPTTRILLGFVVIVVSLYGQSVVMEVLELHFVRVFWTEHG
jgi:hypothetical protein